MESHINKDFFVLIHFVRKKKSIGSLLHEVNKIYFNTTKIHERQIMVFQCNWLILAV